MKTTRFFAGILAAAIVFTAPAFSRADVAGAVHGAAGSDQVDLYGQYSDHVSGIAKDLAKAIGSETDERKLDSIVGTLGQIGLEGGWAKQIGNIKKISGVFDAFGKAIGALQAGDKFGQLVAARQSGDKATFKRIVSETITDVATGLLQSVFTKWVYAHGATAIAGSAAGGPVLMLLTGAGVLVAAWAGSCAIEKAVEYLMSTETMSAILSGIGNRLWNATGDDDAFNNPNPDPGDGGSGGMCPAPSRPVGLTPLQAY